MLRVVKIPFLFFIMLLFVKLTSAANAGELYVLKNLKVHTEASLESPVTHLLLGGEKIEVLSIDGDFTEVLNVKAQKGWVASEFLSDIKPTNIKIPAADKLTAKESLSKKEKNNQNLKKINTKVSNPPPLTSQQLKLNQDSKKSIEQLQYDNQQLQGKIKQIRNILNMTSVDTDNDNIRKQIEYGLTFWLSIGGFLFSFILGYLWSDFRNRKRHGGFKI